MKNIHFLSEEHSNEYVKNGYIKTDLLSREDIKSLRYIYHTYDKDYKESFYCSNWSTDCNERRKEHIAISKIIAPKLDVLISGFKILYSCFITKRRSIHGIIHPHIDWQFVSEPDTIAYNIWIPLSDTNLINGNLWLAPGSHFRINEPRGPNIEVKLDKDWYAHKQNIKLKAGSAIIYDTRLIHGSNRNIFSKKRIAIAMIIVPENAQILHHFFNPVSNQVHTYNVDESFYIEKCNFKKLNTNWELSPGLT